ncbi:MAG: IS30 family transposase [Spiroplasma sp.]|nr:IS30 family transposase [Mycoplasmatales bacterium]
MSYKHLNLEQREIIAYKRNVEKLTLDKIASSLNISKSTISRELKRNSIHQQDSMWKVNSTYIPKCANDLYLKRRAKSVKRKLSMENKNIIKNLLKKDYSPEQISGVNKKKNRAFPSSRTIYNYIYDGKITIPKNYRLKLKKRANQRNTKIKNKLLYCNTIHERPIKINMNKSYGHWEIDLIESAGNGGYIITFVERLTRFFITEYIASKYANNVNRFIRKVATNHIIKSITTDNGSEFNQLYKFTFSSNIKIYYTDPGSPYQKGLVEETNKLLREYIAKNKEFNYTIIRPLKVYTEKINFRPKKVLNFLSPNFTFNQLNVV